MLAEYLSLQFSRRRLIRVKFKSTVQAGAHSGFLAFFVALSVGFLTARFANVSVRFYGAQLIGQMVRLPRNDSEIFTGMLVHLENVRLEIVKDGEILFRARCIIDTTDIERFGYVLLKTRTKTRKTTNIPHYVFMIIIFSVHDFNRL